MLLKHLDSLVRAHEKTLKQRTQNHSLILCAHIDKKYLAEKSSVTCRKQVKTLLTNYFLVAYKAFLQPNKPEHGTAFDTMTL